MNRRQTAGHVLPLLAVCLGAVLGFGGVAVDVGFLEYKQQTQQVATDAAALGGAEQLAHSNCSHQGEIAAQAVATGDASINGFSSGVTAESPPDKGPYKNVPCALSVQINTPNVQTFFTQLFGWTTGMPESTQAIASVTPTSNATPCIYLLSPTTNVNWNSSNVQAPQCAIYMNDTSNFNGSTVNAAAIGEVNYGGSNNSGTFTEATPQPMLPVANPCSTIPGCAYLAANPPSTSNCVNLEEPNQTVTLNGGCYNDLNLSKSNVTLKSGGVFVLNGTSNFNNATVVGSGVTVYVTASGTPPNFNSTNVTLTPPTSGNYAGVTYYQVSTNTNNPNFNGTSNSYGGLIYAPSSNAVNYNASNGGYVVLVFGSANFNNSAPQDFSTPAPGQALVNKAVIVQ